MRILTGVILACTLSAFGLMGASAAHLPAHNGFKPAASTKAKKVEAKPETKKPEPKKLEARVEPKKIELKRIEAKSEPKSKAKVEAIREASKKTVPPPLARKAVAKLTPPPKMPPIDRGDAPGSEPAGSN